MASIIGPRMSMLYWSENFGLSWRLDKLGVESHYCYYRMRQKMSQWCHNGAAMASEYVTMTSQWRHEGVLSVINYSVNYLSIIDNDREIIG